MTKPQESLASLLILAIGLSARASETEVPVLVDTDIGSYLDDSFAIGLLATCPEVDLCGVATSGGDTQTRAWIARRFLQAAGRTTTPIGYGRDPQPAGKVEALHQYRYHPALLYGRSGKLAPEDPADLWHQQLKANPGQIKILALGPLTNVARLIEKYPDCKPWIRRIVCMAGALEVGLDGPPVQPEWNVKTDIPAARAVLASGVPLLIVPLDVTRTAKLSAGDCQRLFATQTILTQQLQAMYQLVDEREPGLHDVVAAGVVMNEELCDWKEMCLTIDDAGITRAVEGRPNCKIATSAKQDEVVRLCHERITALGAKVSPRELRNFAELVERGGLPSRVHVFEDYETDIERRWWLSGKLLAPEELGAGSRAMRSVLTLDFDDLQGDLKTLYAAVVFNPVPGPPMGPNTRLAFRYRLQGTDQLRVQLYSLSNGYHRHLTLRGLPQNEWREAAVDMTQLRRPDESGGPLSQDERIDDIPTAEVQIDDIVLYEVAPKNEQRPFPKRLVFTGWFDTGKQGVEWPGDFEIVPHVAPRTWKAAKTVLHKETGKPWIRISLRGARPVGSASNLRFDGRIAGADSFEVILVNSRSGQRIGRKLEGLKTAEWRTHELQFQPENKASFPAADELHFLIPDGAELVVDDVLLYEPAGELTSSPGNH